MAFADTDGQVGSAGAPENADAEQIASKGS